MSVYVAVDQSVDQTVLVVEHPGSEVVPVPAHAGLLKFTHSFVMNGRRYDVTEPVELRSPTKPVAKTWDEFSTILMAMNSLSAGPSMSHEIGPKTLVSTSESVYKLLPVESEASQVEIEAWHIPIERIWHDLDHISQKAIYNAWDEASIADLERPVDEASDLYSLAALFYHIFAEITPPSAFERTVVGLDESDPLVAPQALEPALGDEAGAFLVKCLELRRDRRFGSFEEAIMSLPTLSLPKREVDDEDDPLEIEAPARTQQRTTANTILAEVDVLQAVEVAANDIAEPATQPVTQTQPTVQVQTDDDNVPSFAFEKVEKSGVGMKFVLAGVFIAVAGGIGWGLYQFSQTNAVVTPVSAEVAAPIVRTEPVAAPSPGPTEDITATSASVTSDPDTAQAARTDAAHPRQTAAVKPAAKAPSTSETKAKKKVTVDDLINDN
ncbi:MAG: hypothetical protein ACJ73D_01035 [Pyrinomonadaceae bacterium]